MLLAFLVGCYGGTKPTRIGTDAPDFTVQDGAQKVSLRDLHGQVVVLNFWATWCPPCVEEMPSLVAMQSQLKARGVTVLAVSVDIDKSAYEKFVREHAGDLQTVRDPDQKSNVLYGTYKFPGDVHHRPQGRNPAKVHWSRGLDAAGYRAVFDELVVGSRLSLAKSSRPRRRFRLLRTTKDDRQTTLNVYSSTFLSRSEFVITETELKLMAAAAIIGLSRIPKNG